MEEADRLLQQARLAIQTRGRFRALGEEETRWRRQLKQKELKFRNLLQTHSQKWLAIARYRANKELEFLDWGTGRLLGVVKATTRLMFNETQALKELRYRAYALLVGNQTRVDSMYASKHQLFSEVCRQATKVRLLHDRGWGIPAPTKRRCLQCALTQADGEVLILTGQVNCQPFPQGATPQAQSFDSSPL